MIRRWSWISLHTHKLSILCAPRKGGGSVAWLWWIVVKSRMGNYYYYCIPLRQDSGAVQSLWLQLLQLLLLLLIERPATKDVDDDGWWYYIGKERTHSRIAKKRHKKTGCTCDQIWWWCCFHYIHCRPPCTSSTAGLYTISSTSQEMELAIRDQRKGEYLYSERDSRRATTTNRHHHCDLKVLWSFDSWNESIRGGYLKSDPSPSPGWRLGVAARERDEGEPLQVLFIYSSNLPPCPDLGQESDTTAKAGRRLICWLWCRQSTLHWTEDGGGVDKGTDFIGPREQLSVITIEVEMCRPHLWNKYDHELLLVQEMLNSLTIQWPIPCPLDKL